MNEHNAAIFILSARNKMLPVCLKNFSICHPCSYDLYVYQFGNIYTESDKEKVKNSYSGKVEFISLNPKVPNHISEDEMFYNRKYNPYVRQSFPKKRLNYLHMCDFYTWQVFERKELEKYEFLMRFDDDSWFKKEFGFNLIDKFIEEETKRGGEIYCINSYFWGAGSDFNHRHSNTRENLFKFFVSYTNENEVLIKNEKARQVINNLDELAFHSLGWKSDLNVWRNGFNKEKKWKSWIKAVTDYGGSFKYRWGDIEIQQLYSHMYFKDGIVDLDLKEKGLYYGHLPSYYMIVN